MVDLRTILFYCELTRAFRISQDCELTKEFQPILIGRIIKNKSPGTSPGDVKAVSRILLPQRASTIDLRNLPSSIGRVALKHWFTWSCSPKGLPKPCGHPTRWWALTPPSHPYLCLAAIGGLNLCSTVCHPERRLLFQRVRYPALSGLSSLTPSGVRRNTLNGEDKKLSPRSPRAIFFIQARL